MRLTISGYGVMGERLLRNALLHPDVTIQGVWDPSPAAMARLTEQFPQVPRCASFEELLTGSDCLYIASPPRFHIPAIGAAFAAGLAVFCEKPLAIDPVAATLMVEKAEQTGQRAGVNFPFASTPAITAMQDWLAEGRIGLPVSATIRMGFAVWPRPWQQYAANWLIHRAEGGFTREVGSHFLFLTRRLLGPMLLTAATCEYGAGELAETAIDADLLAGGYPVHLTGSVGTTEAADTNEWCLTGTIGAMRLRDWTSAEWRDGDGPWQTATSLSMEESRARTLRGQLDQLIACTAGQPTRLASLREALDVQKIVEAILQAH